MDLIDRDKLIKALEEEIRAGNEYLKDNPNEKCEELYLKGVRYALIVALSQPTVNQWISCSERLPEEPLFSCDGYIVQQYDVVEPFSAYWDGEMWTDVDDEEVKGIIAWQPLPAPYKVLRGNCEVIARLRGSRGVSEG